MPHRRCFNAWFKGRMGASDSAVHRQGLHEAAHLALRCRGCGCSCNYTVPLAACKCHHCQQGKEGGAEHVSRR